MVLPVVIVLDDLVHVLDQVPVRTVRGEEFYEAGQEGFSGINRPVKSVVQRIPAAVEPAVRPCPPPV